MNVSIFWSLVRLRSRPLPTIDSVRVPPTTQLLVGETDKNHHFVQQEQMMPFVPFVRVRDVDEAIDLAIESEHGYRHTALIHSRNLDTITRFGRRANTTLLKRECSIAIEHMTHGSCVR